MRLDRLTTNPVYVGTAALGCPGNVRVGRTLSSDKVCGDSHEAG